MDGGPPAAAVPAAVPVGATIAPPNRLWVIDRRATLGPSIPVVYYVGPDRLAVPEVAGGRVPAIIEVVWRDDAVDVVWLRSDVKGCGTLLVLAVAHRAVADGVDRIRLDDHTSRFGQADNLYRRLGFRYLDNGPEMEAPAATVANFFGSDNQWAE